MFGKKTLAVAFCAALLSASALSAPALAQEGPDGPGGPGGFGHHGGGMGHGALAFLHGINLTDAQKTQIEQMREAQLQQVKPVMKQLRDIHKQIFEQLMGSGSLNTAQLTGLQQQASQLRTQIDAENLNMAIQVRGVLTPAQLQQASQLHEQLGQLRAQERALMHPQSSAQ